MIPLPLELRAEAVGEDARDGRDLPDEVAAVTGPLWRDAHTCTWPRSGGAGTCSHHAPDSCSYCDGSLDDQREAAKVRRAAKRTDNPR